MQVKTKKIIQCEKESMQLTLPASCGSISLSVTTISYSKNEISFIDVVLGEKGLIARNAVISLCTVL
jgi:hypothetical protein